MACAILRPFAPGEEQRITEVNHTISWWKALFLLSRQYKGCSAKEQLATSYSQPLHAPKKLFHVFTRCFFRLLFLGGAAPGSISSPCFRLSSADAGKEL